MASPKMNGKYYNDLKYVIVPISEFKILYKKNIWYEISDLEI